MGTGNFGGTVGCLLIILPILKHAYEVQNREITEEKFKSLVAENKKVFDLKVNGNGGEENKKQPKIVPGSRSNGFIRQ